MWGLIIQFCLGLFILRTRAGFDAFSWIGNLARVFIDYVTAGVIFLFGKSYGDHFFAFKVIIVDDLRYYVCMKWSWYETAISCIIVPLNRDQPVFQVQRNDKILRYVIGVACWFDIYIKSLLRFTFT